MEVSAENGHRELQGPDRLSGLETRIVESLARGPQTALELNRELGLAEGTLWGVLAALRRAGLVQIAYVRHRGYGNGSGRGRAIYQLAESRGRTAPDRPAEA